MLHRHSKASKDAPEFLLSSLPVEMHLYPGLAEFLFVRTWPDDGSDRETGTINVFGDGQNLKVMLNDRAQALVAFVTVDPDEDLLVTIENALSAKSTDWRPAKKYTKPK